MSELIELTELVLGICIMIFINVCCCGCIWSNYQTCVLPDNEHTFIILSLKEEKPIRECNNKHESDSLKEEKPIGECNNKYESEPIIEKISNEHTDIAPSLSLKQIETIESEKGLFDDDDENLHKYFERLSKKVEEEIERKFRDGTTINEREFEKI
ncbi:hypothetical protein RhiirA4_457743 [Rhizophagus irregularis]|uniref:Uncharacterized protein n=1 Tax=Rhizophagus irregularis TaxID=588596 RepID=A0A2I1GAM9_9GLOM|nr:hypothetical protein RhiirA4_457743 [Rhizophagus irregularis]